MSLRQQNKLRARAQIISAAEQLMAEVGVENASTRQIAKLAGVSYQTLYNYYPTKADLIRAMLDDEFELLSQEIDQLIKRYEGNLVASFLSISEAGMDRINGPKRELWGELAKVIFQSKPDLEHIAKLTTVAHEHYYAVLAQAHGVGDLHPDTDLHLLAHTIFCLADYNLLMFYLMPMEVGQFLNTQRQQFELVIHPYLAHPPTPE